MGFGALTEFFNNNPDLLGENVDAEEQNENREEEEIIEPPQEDVQINFENPNINLDNDDVDIEIAIGLKGDLSSFVQNASSMIVRYFEILTQYKLAYK